MPGAETLLSPEDIVEEVGDRLMARIKEHLDSDSDLFVSAGPLWLTTDQMVEVNIGHLNIAEAAIEMNDLPIETKALMGTVDLSPDASASVRTFSLETALYADGRFVQVGQEDATAWYLRRMMPDAAVAIPDFLQYEPVVYDVPTLMSSCCKPSGNSMTR